MEDIAIWHNLIFFAQLLSNKKEKQWSAKQYTALECQYHNPPPQMQKLPEHA
jgi:hypothetical protein